MYTRTQNARRRSLRRGAAFAWLAEMVFAFSWTIVLATSARATIPPDLPMVQRPGAGVRALGMGGATAALSDDADGLAANPAGLARVGELLLSASIQSRSLENRTTYLGGAQSAPLDKSRIHGVGFVYPFPTDRGSLVIGFSYNREAEFDQEYLRRSAEGAARAEEESILEEGGLGAWRAGVAVDVSPTLSLGASGAILTGSSRRERRFEYRAGSGGDRERTSTVVDLDLNAVSGTLGALYRSRSGLRIGLALHLPESYDADGSAAEDVLRYQSVGDTLDYIDSYNFEDEFQLPFRTSVGVAYAPDLGRHELVVTAQWDYADWQQIDYDGPVRAEDRTFAYRATHDWRVGAEYRIPTTPLQVRAGFLRQPVAYRLIGTDVFLGEARTARFDPDRRYVTLGATLDLDPTFRLEAAWSSGRFVRSATSVSGVETREEVRDRRLVLGATFRI